MIKNFIDDMVPEFGYDYVIGYCLCSEYDLNRKASIEDDERKASSLRYIANKYGRTAEQLTKERIENGL